MRWSSQHTQLRAVYRSLQLVLLPPPPPLPSCFPIVHGPERAHATKRRTVRSPALNTHRLSQCPRTQLLTHLPNSLPHQRNTKTKNTQFGIASTLPSGHPLKIEASFLFMNHVPSLWLPHALSSEFLQRRLSLKSVPSLLTHPHCFYVGSPIFKPDCCFCLLISHLTLWSSGHSTLYYANILLHYVKYLFLLSRTPECIQAISQILNSEYLLNIFVERSNH